MGGVGVNAGYGSSSGSGSNSVRYRGDNSGLSGGGTINDLLFAGLGDYANSGAMSDLIMGGQGFGQSRRYRQYDPYDKNYGYMTKQHGGGTPTGNPAGPGGGAPPGTPKNPETGNGTKAPHGEDPYSMALAPGAEEQVTQPGAPGGAPRGPGNELGPGQQPNPIDPETGKPYYSYDSLGREGAYEQNPQWFRNDDAPVEGQGLLGDVQNYGQRTAIDDRLENDLGWQAGGDLMDLESRELGRWEDFGKQNQIEKASEDAIGWQRTGALSDLEQEEKWGYTNYADATDLENEVGDSYRGLAGPGQYDAMRGKTLTDMVQNPGLSSSEKSSMKASQLLPIQAALEAQKLEGNARQAATGNAAGRWGASNAMALNAAGQAAQAGRNVELDSANILRQDRAQGLSGVGDLQGQIDARKAQGAQGLSNLSGQQRQAGALSLSGLSNVASKSRDAQQYGINAGMQLNDQQRNAQATAAQGVGGLGQRQRANTQWGLGALSDFGKQKDDQALQKIGVQTDLWKNIKDQGNAGADRAAQLAGLAAGGQNAQGSSSFNAGVSV